MHSPETVAFEIKNIFVKKDKWGYRPSLITIWHHDTEKDGTDDSCGWFIRPRHADQKVLNEIKSEFDFNFKHNYWFDKEGRQVFSTIGTLMLMYQCAAYKHFNGDRKKKDAFMRKHCASIIHFAENPVDCAGDDITGKFYLSTNSNLLSPERFNGMAGMIYSDILRKERKWYQHPKWHIHHWKLQIHPIQKFKRRWLDKCCICGKRGFKGSAIGDWNGTEIWHEECNSSTAKTDV
jgi:hypothetical protein